LASLHLGVFALEILMYNLFTMKIVFLLLIGLGAVMNIAGQSESQKTKITAEIRKVMLDQAVAWNRGDIEGFMAGYWRSENLTFVSGTEVTRGWQPTVDRYKRGYDTRAKMGTLTFSDLEVTVLSKDAAVVLGNWSLAREKDNPHGKFTLTFRKFKEGWRVVIDHTS
jgi:ketosteroid isomerase-like protein